MMIAARNAFLMSGGSSTPTARDYVRDGLTSLWDGIENAGWGTHDSNATTWKNLAHSGNVLELRNGAHFDANSLVSADRNSVSALLPYRLSYVTIEVCAYMDTSRNSSVLICFGNDLDSARMMAVSSDFFEIYNPSQQNLAPPLADSPHTWTATYSPNANVAYIDGVPPVVASTSTNSWSWRSGTFGLSGSSNYSSYNFVGNYYCVRIYNRALTAAEVAANYAVDAARFNL